MLAQDVIVVTVQLHSVLLDVSKELFSAQNLRNFDKLVVVVFALEEWLLLENHASKHAAK